MTTIVPSRIAHEQGPRHIVGAGFDIAVHEGRRRAARVVPGTGRVCVVGHRLGPHRRRRAGGLRPPDDPRGVVVPGLGPGRRLDPGARLVGAAGPARQPAADPHGAGDARDAGDERDGSRRPAARAVGLGLRGAPRSGWSGSCTTSRDGCWPPTPTTCWARCCATCPRPGEWSSPGSGERPGAAAAARRAQPVCVEPSPQRGGEGSAHTSGRAVGAVGGARRTAGPRARRRWPRGRRCGSTPRRRPGRRRRARCADRRGSAGRAGGRRRGRRRCRWTSRGPRRTSAARRWSAARAAGSPRCRRCSRCRGGCCGWGRPGRRGGCAW